MRHELYLNRRATLIVALVVSVLMLVIGHISNAIEGREMDLYDWRVASQAGPAAPSPLLIVAIDNASLKALKMWGPGSLARENYVSMIRNLTDAGAAVIGLDVAMVKASARDAELARALEDAGNVVLVADAVAEVEEGGRRESFTFHDPAPRLAGAARTVASPLMYRPDNVVRRFHAWQVTEDGTRLFPSLAAALAQSYDPQLARHTPDVTVVGRDPASQLRWIRWTSSSPAFEVLSAKDVVRNEFGRDEVRDKIVIIGRWDQMEDTLQTPLGAMPGVEIHAHAVATMLGGPWLRRWPVANALLAITLALIIAGLGARLRSGHTLLLTLAFIAGLVIVAVLTFRVANVWIEIAPTALVLASVGVFVGVMQSELSLAFVGERWPDWVSSETQELVATILVCDIRGYTTRSETERAQEVMRALEDFFAAVDRAVEPHGAIAARRPGDAAMILFRDEPGQPGHADRAVRAAIDLRAVLQGLAAEFRARGRKPLETGTTLVTGEVSLGLLGTSPPEPQIIGDPVNTAFRLQDFARDSGCQLLISGDTVAALTEQFPLERVGATRVRGREAETELFTIPPPDVLQD